MNTVLVVYSQNLAEFKQQFIFELEECLREAEYEVVNSESLQEAAEIVAINPRIVAVLYDWDDFGFESLHHFSALNRRLPVFAIANKHAAMDINIDDFDMSLDFLQYDANLVQEDFNRVMLAIEHYCLAVLPPFTRHLMHYVDELNYAFCTPGHLGGTAFQKTPTGAAFYDFLGSNVFKADISISISIDEMGESVGPLWTTS